MEFDLKILKIIDETHDVKTFRLERPKDFDFLAGQYCLVRLSDTKKPFTLSSSPLETSYLDLTVKKIGDFTKKMFSLKPGDTITIDEPKSTKMTFEDRKDIIFIAGGSGITPFMSALRYAIQKNSGNSFTLFYANWTTKDIIFKDELEELNKKENIRVIHVLCEEDIRGCEKGFITKDIITKHADLKKEQLWYLCGPPKMVDSVKEILCSLNIPKENKRIDSWQLPGKRDS